MGKTKNHSARKRRNVQGEKKRFILIKTAAKLFSQRGYFDASINDIAKLAGTKTSAIIYHFDTKKNLFYTTIKYYFLNLAKLDTIFDYFDYNDADNNPQIFGEALYNSANHLLTILFDEKKKIPYLSGLVSTLLVDARDQIDTEIRNICYNATNKLIDKLRILRPELSENKLYWARQFYWAMVLYSIFGNKFILCDIGSERKYPREFLDAYAYRITIGICKLLDLPYPEKIGESWVYNKKRLV